MNGILPLEFCEVVEDCDEDNEDGTDDQVDLLKLDESHKCDLGKQPFSCEVCSKSFAREDHMQRHLRTHFKTKTSPANTDSTASGKNQYKCDFQYKNGSKCGKFFRDRKQLHRHIKIHSDLKLYCDICGKAFSNTSSVRKHVMFVHSDVKTFQCYLCSNTFTKKDLLLHHFRTHSAIVRTESDIESLSCEICSKTFATSGTKQTQLRRTHFKNDTDQGLDLNVKSSRRYKCTLCSKDYSRGNHLRRHMLSHLPKQFSCEVCSKAFGRQDHLHKHELTHLSVKPFSCEVCSKAFRREDNLKAHFRTHFNANGSD